MHTGARGYLVIEVCSRLSLRHQQPQYGHPSSPPAILPSRKWAQPVPLRREADPRGLREGKRGKKLPGPQMSCRPQPDSALRALRGQQACCSAWDLNTYSVHFSTTVFSPCQPRQAALMDYLHYLPHHCLNIYQTIMYLVARSGEWKGQKGQNCFGQMQELITDWLNPPDLKIKLKNMIGRLKGDRYLHVRKSRAA